MAGSILARLAVLISGDTSGLNKSLKKTNDQLAGFSKVAKLAGGALAGIGVASVAKDIINITAKFQKFQAVLTNTLGSRSAALGAMDEIKDFAAKTPFSVDELTASFVKLVNQGFKPTREQMTNLGDLAASQGKSFDQLTEAIIDAQTGEFERLKEFGIRASKAGDEVKFTFKGVETQTKFTADSIREYILSLGGAAGVSGSMASISGTLGGKLSNLGDNLDQIATSLGNKSSGVVGGFIDMANTLLGSLNAALNDQVGTLQKERFELNVLVDSITDVNTSEEARKVLLQELNQKYPDFLKNLNLETVTNAQLRDRLEDVNKQFERKILLIAAEKELAKVSERIIQTVNKEAEARKTLAESRANAADELAAQNRVAATGAALTNKSSLDIVNAENNIARATEERKNLQDELQASMKAYNEALGIFNSTENDYFVTTEKATKATNDLKNAQSGLIETLNKSIKVLEERKNKAFDVESIAQFNIKIQELRDELELLNLVGSESGFLKNLNAGLPQGTTDPSKTENPLLGAFPTELPVPNTEELKAGLLSVEAVKADLDKKEQARYEDDIARHAARLAMQQEQANAAAQYGDAIGSAFGDAASGQITFAQAAKRATADIVKTLLARAMAGIIASAATAGGPPPVAIALAAAGVAAIGALFSKFVGVGGGGSSGGGAVGQTPRGTNVSRMGAVTRPEDRIILDAKFEIEGTKLVAVANNTNRRSERTG